MEPELLAETVAAVRERQGRDGVPAHVELEATGNLTLEKARKVAATGVDFLSVGALTHSAPILDLALDLRA
jgi:nicotinate-nucleotide pyrophosphorylase (carboxylating)